MSVLVLMLRLLAGLVVVLIIGLMLGVAAAIVRCGQISRIEEQDDK